MMTEADKVQDMKRIYETHSTAMLSVWNDMRECFDYVNGNQTTAAQKTYLTDLGRVVRAFNIVQSQIIVIDGYVVKNPLRLRVVPREPGDRKTADAISEVMAQSYDECNFAWEVQRANSDAVISGRGFIWNGWLMPSERYIDGQYIGKRINPFDVVYDISDQSKLISDGAFIMVTRWYPFDQIISEWGSGKPELATAIDQAAGKYETADQTARRRKSSLSNQFSYGNLAFNTVRDGTKGQMNVDRTANLSNYILQERGLARVISMSERRWADVIVVMDPKTGDEHRMPQEISPEEQRLWVQLTLAATGQTGNEMAVQPKTIPEYWEVNACPGLLQDALLDEAPADAQGEGHAIKEIRCYDYDPEKDRHRGIVHHIRDAQDSMNRLESIKQDVLMKTLYPDYQMEEGMVTSKWFGNWKSRKIARLLIRPKGVKAAKREDMPAYVGNLIDQDLNFNLELAQKISLISPFISGQKMPGLDNATLYRDLVEQSEIGISPILQNLKKSFIECGRYHLALLQRFETLPRWIRTINRGGDVEFKYKINTFDPNLGKALLDVKTGKYDVIIDAQPTSKFEKQRKALEIRDSMQYADDFGKSAMLPHYLDYLDLPDADILKNQTEVAYLLKTAPELFAGIDPFTKARLLLGDKEIRQVIDQQEMAAKMGQMTPDMQAQLGAGIERQDHPQLPGIPMNPQQIQPQITGATS